MVILPPKMMSAEDITILRNNGICVVIAKDPAKVRFMDPIPAVSSRSEIENAAIKLSRKLIKWPWSSDMRLDRQSVTEIYVNLLVDGTPLDPLGTTQEQEERIQREAREEELRRLGREEAKAIKAAKAKKTEPKTT